MLIQESVCEVKERSGESKSYFMIILVSSLSIELFKVFFNVPVL